MGFWVAMTRWGRGSGHDSPSTRHLLLLHRLEQGRLGTRRRAVELVDEHDMGEHRAGSELPCAGVRREHRHAGDVGGQKVGMALDPRQLGPERGRQGPGQHGLAHPGNVLDEQVPAAERGDGRRRERSGHSEQHPAQVGHQGAPELDGTVDVHGRRARPPLARQPRVRRCRP